MTSGVQEINDARARQIEQHGYHAVHDDSYTAGQLVVAAVRYANVARLGPSARNLIRTGDAERVDAGMPLASWPAGWSATGYRIGANNNFADRIRELAKAGALLAAEIDRLKRAARAAGVEGGGS